MRMRTVNVHERTRQRVRGGMVSSGKRQSVMERKRKEVRETHGKVGV